MTIKINTPMPMPSQLTSATGPSQSYYEAQNRFQTILQSKLNINPAVKAQGVQTAKGQDFGFNAQDVLQKSGVSSEKLNDKLKGTALEGMGQDFVQAEQKYGINAWFLTGLAIHESGFGTSRIAQDKNNLFGFKAYDSSPYASAARFNTLGESVDKVAQYLSENYTNPNGKYYNGSSVEGIGKRYATDPNWANAVKARIEQLMK